MLTIEDKKNLIKALTDLETEYPPSVLLQFLSDHTLSPSRVLVDQPEFKATDLVKDQLAIVVQRGQKSIRTQNGAWIAKLITQISAEVEANSITDTKQGRAQIKAHFNKFYANIKHHVDTLNTFQSADVINAELKNIALDSFPKTPVEQKEVEVTRRTSEPFYRDAAAFFNHKTIEIFLAQDAKQLSERVGTIVSDFPDHPFTKVVTTAIHRLKDFQPTEVTMPLYVAVAKAIVEECSKFKKDSPENVKHLVGLLRGIKKDNKERPSFFSKDKRIKESTGVFSELLRGILKDSYPKYKNEYEITPDPRMLETIQTVYASAQLKDPSKTVSASRRYL